MTVAPTPWPGLEAWRRLEEMEQEPTDWPYHDIETLLDLWEVTEAGPECDPNRYRTRFHRDAPALLFRYRLAQKLRPEVVTGICSMLRMLYRRLVE